MNGSSKMSYGAKNMKNERIAPRGRRKLWSAKFRKWM
jgi:hypothetical protein